MKKKCFTQNLFLNDDYAFLKKNLLVLSIFFIGLSSITEVWGATLHLTSTSSGNQIYIYKWGGTDANTWPGTQIASAAVQYDYGTGGFYSNSLISTNYILNNNNSGQTGNLSITEDTWGQYNGTNTFNLLMTTSTMSTSGIVQFASGGYSGGWTTHVNTTYSSSTFSLTAPYTSGNGFDIYINGTKFLYVAPTSITGYSTSYSASPVTMTFDPTTGTLSMAAAAVPAITGISSSLPAFSSTQTYKGATVTVTGTNLGSVTTIKLGGSGGTSITTSSPTTIGATSITFVVPDATSTGTVYVSDGTNTSTSSALTNLGNITNAASDWNIGSTWLGGTVPAASSNVTVAHAITLNNPATFNPSSITINASTGITYGSSGSITAGTFTNNGTVDMTSGGTLNIAAAGTFTNNATFTYGTGTVNFAGTGTVSGTVGFNNVVLAGGVDFGSGSTVNGFLNIHLGGYVNINAPTYATGSILKYNSGTSYGASAEWATNIATGAGVPCNVVIGDEIASSGVTFGSSSSYRYATGNVTISNATSGSSLTLSSVSGGDLQLAGDFTNNGTFNASNRAIFFKGGNTQNINGTQTNINYVIIDKTGGSVNVITNLISDVLTLTNGTLNVNAGKQLTVNTTLTNNGTLNLLSTSTDGTATILSSTSSGSGKTVVQQYLGTARNWYVSSPVSNAKAPSGYTYYQRDETGASWTTQPFVETNTFIAGKGYIALPGTTGSTLTFTTESGGQLNTGNVDVTLTKGGTTTAVGYNLIGNPYPCHLTWTATFVDDLTNAALIEPSIWIRTNAGTVNSGGDASWSFLTYNGHSGEAVPSTSLLTGGIIPPMQAFWVRALQPGTLTLDSKLAHSHQSSNPLKARDVNNNTDRQRLRLEVSNGTSTDETLVYFDAAAANGYDAYDSPKFPDTTAPVQIYTTTGTEQLVINGMNSIPYDTELPLGFTTGQSNAFSIKATEFSNFDTSTKVYLKDNLLNTQQDLTDGTAYTFTSDVASNTSRFSVVFKSIEVTTGAQAASVDQAVVIYKNANNQIAVNCNGFISDNAFISVYNALGQKLEVKKITGATTVIGRTFTSGVYMVTVNNGGTSTTKRVILN